MLDIKVPAIELFDDRTQEFVNVKEQTIRLEHSLVSISKWESKWKKPFLSSEKNAEEILDYIKCMSITQNVPDVCYYHISSSEIDRVVEYIQDTMTATWFSDRDNNRHRMNSEIVTSELIYYWMIELNIPVEFQKWHLNRLITLIKVCSVKNAPNKKMSKRELASRQSKLNAERRAKMNSRG